MATILGLLLVVTFIANYLTTTLPSAMGQNDLQHEVQVQNQVAQLASLAQETALKGKVGAQVSGPVALGSDGTPPFAGQDGSSISPLAPYSNASLISELAGPSVYSPPTGFPVGNLAYLASTCLPRPPTVTVNCAAVNRAHPIDWNFSAGDGLAYTVTLGTGGNHVQLYFATNQSTITISGVSGMPIFIQIVGSFDTLTIANNGGGNNPISVNITGNYDNITAGSFPGGASTVFINVVGNHDFLNGDTAAGGNTFYVSILGAYDTFAVVPGSGSTYYTYFTGFDVQNPVSPTCPYGALSHTDSVIGYSITNGNSANAHLFQSFNNSTSFPGNSTHSVSSRWSIVNQTVSPFLCPFTSSVQIPISPVISAGFVVHLRNTYAPSAEVAFDQGAVVYAQPSSVPVFILPPRVSYGNGVLTLFVPQFTGRVGSEAGVGTADVSLRLLSATHLVIPTNSFSFQSGSVVNFTVKTPYAAAWFAFFQSSSLSPFVSCSGAKSVCTALYNPGGPLGTVTISVPTGGLKLDLLFATYAVTLG